MQLDIEKFSPVKAELESLVEKAKLITKDSSDQEMHEMRMRLVKKRTAIALMGKLMREEAIQIQKAVIKKQDDLIEMIKPEEDRIAALEEEIEFAKEREERKALVPQRMARIEAIADGQPFPGDEVLLDMDGPQFEGYLNQRVAAKNQKEQNAIDAEKRRLEQERADLEREKQLREREENARREERGRVEREALEKQAGEAREKQAASERAEREKVALEERKAREEAEMRKNERITAYLTEMGWTKELEARGHFKIERGENKIILWKRAGTFETIN